MADALYLAALDPDIGVVPEGKGGLRAFIDFCRGGYFWID